MQDPALAARRDGPVDTLREALPLLRRPFAPEAVKFKVQTVFKEAKGCIVVAYIDARLVIERLNLVVPDMWAARYEPIDGTKLAWCHLTIAHEHVRDSDLFGSPSPSIVVTRSDVGESPKGMSKDLVSDALKRAAVHFGVGVSIYALPQITLYANQPHVEKRGSSLALTEVGHTKLREGYAKWLTRDHGFGEPLSHGDVEGQTLDPEAEAEEFVPAAAPALDDDAARILLERIDEAYLALRERDPQALPPGRFNAMRSGAAHSHTELQRLLDYLTGRLS